MDYDRRNQSYMHDDEYLARGWPIGTSVVEGSGHLVKDRMEQSGMRWTKAGAQAVLDLRAVRINGHGLPIGSFIGNSNISACTARPPQRQHC